MLRHNRDLRTKNKCEVVAPFLDRILGLVVTLLKNFQNFTISIKKITQLYPFDLLDKTYSVVLLVSIIIHTYY